MRTSLHEIKAIEEHLFGKNLPEEAVIMEARILIDAELKDRLKWQSETYEVIRRSGREQLKAELARVHRKLFTERQYSNFRHKILRLFKK